MENCKNCKHNGNCKYQIAFDIDKVVGCLEWEDKDKTKFISNTTLSSNISYIDPQQEFNVSTEEKINNIQNSIAEDKIRNNLEHKIMEEDVKILEESGRKCFIASICLSTISFILWTILLIMKLVGK